MRTYIFLVLAALASIAVCQRFEIPQARGRSLTPQEGPQARRRLRPRGPPPRQPTLNDFTNIRSRPRPRPAPVQNPRPAPIDTSSILQQAIAKHRPRPPPTEPQPIQNVRPAPPVQLPTFEPPKPDTFEPTTFRSSTGPRPLPLNLDKILQIPRIENEAVPQDAGSTGSLRPSLPPLGNTFPRKESHFDDALRQVLEGPPHSTDSNTFRIPPRTQPKPSNPSPFQNPQSPPRFLPPRPFPEPSPSLPPTPPPTKPAPKPGPRPKPIRIEDAFDLPSFKPVKPSKPVPVVKIARPPRPVQTFTPSVQTISRAQPPSRQQQQEFVSRNQPPQRQSPQFITRTQASRRPPARPEFIPEQPFAVNENQHISLVKEEQLAKKPIDFQDAKLRNDPVKVITNYMHRNEDGTFTWGYEGEDGSFKEETRGKDCIVRGRYGYVDPTGVKREFTYETGNPCDPDAIAKQKEAAAEGFYDYDKGVYITPEGKEVPLNIKANRRRQ